VPFSPRQMVQRPRRESCGNAALLVLVDSRGSYTDTHIVEETVLCALEHYKLPYRLHDLADGAIGAESLEDCAAVVIAQSRMGHTLSRAETELITAAVERAGIGLVNFDGELSGYKAPLLEMFGLEVDRIPMASDLLRIGTAGHFVTATQKPGSLVKLNRPVTFAQVKRVGKDVVELAQTAMGKDQLIVSRHNVPGTAYEPDQFPAILATRAGTGRAVQFTCSPRIWHSEFLGHGMGLDAFFWRSIAWAARKPFAALMMPPCVSIRVDDGVGRHDFRYTDVMNRHGHHPLVSCLLDKVPEDLAPFMRAKRETDDVDWDAHAFDYYDLIPFDFGIGERSQADLEDRFRRVDAWYDRLGFGAPRTAYHHWGEIGIRSLPFLKARGRTYVYATYHLGQLKWERLFPNWWPYGLNSLFYDYMPDDPDIYNIGAMLPRHLVQPDVLTGCTTWAGDNATNDMDKAANRAAEAIRLASDSGFFGEMTTHEQKFGVLSLEEIDDWLTRVDRVSAVHNVRKVGHEFAADYTKARDESWIQTSQTHEGRLELTLDGKADVPLDLALFTDEGEGTVLDWRPTSRFRGPEHVEI
jgi:hypothetical protein